MDTGWREILKLYVIGAEGKKRAFLSIQIKSGVFLEDINSILNSGEIQNLFEMMSVKILGITVLFVMTVVS
jgi:hypothetical protein